MDLHPNRMVTPPPPQAPVPMANPSFHEEMAESRDEQSKPIRTWPPIRPHDPSPKPPPPVVILASTALDLPGFPVQWEVGWSHGRLVIQLTPHLHLPPDSSSHLHDPVRFLLILSWHFPLEKPTSRSCKQSDHWLFLIHSPKGFIPFRMPLINNFSNVSD